MSGDTQKGNFIGLLLLKIIIKKNTGLWFSLNSILLQKDKGKISTKKPFKIVHCMH